MAFDPKQFGATRATGTAGFDPSKFGATRVETSEPFIKEPNLAQRIWSDLSQRGEAVASEITKPGQSPITAGFKAAAQAFGGIGDVIGQAIKATPGVRDVAATVETEVSKGFTALTERLAKTKLFREAAEGLDGQSKIEEFLQVLGSSGEISGNILAAEGLRVGSIRAKAGVEDAFKALTTKTERQLDDLVVRNFQKAVKPNIPGKETPGKVEAYEANVRSGIRTISENKTKLSFTDEAGEAITGRNPETLQELVEAVEQTKKATFTKYDDLAKQAGEAGVSVDLNPIAGELDSVVANRALRITNPKAIRYAEALQKRLTNEGRLDATTAQEVIQSYNKSLEAFYKNPTYDNASQAAIDAMVANRLRQALDEGITGLTGEQYQVLKRQYGALKSIERDITKAYIRDARKNIKGLIDFTDIFSGGQVINGILNLNPGQVASGLTQKAIAEYIKYLNNPNRAIKKMFDAVEEIPGQAFSDKFPKGTPRN